MSPERPQPVDTSVSGLFVEKQAPLRVLSGERFEYRVRVTNMANVTLEGVVLVETLLSFLTIERALPRSQADDPHAGRWIFGALAPQASRTVQISCSAQRAMRFRSHTSVSYTVGGAGES